MDQLDVLLLKAGEQTYAMPLMQIQEIRGWTPVSKVPSADPSCLGVLNLRGSVLAVLDARRILGKPVSEPRPQDVIVVAVSAGQPVGLLVDGVSDIVSIDASLISKAITGESWSSELIEGIATVGEQLVPLLALDKLTGRASGAAPAALLEQAAA